jgi:probable H4MPT-linked C1 transfer pathway protein
MAVFLGLDIGGANTKLCLLEMKNGSVVRAEGTSVYHEVWKDPQGLLGVLESFKQDQKGMIDRSSLQGIALTMTAELCDVFQSKAEGVLAILRLAELAFDGIPIHVWTTDGVFLNITEARMVPQKVAAANWLASALALARSPLIKTSSALFVDMGSTTTDILPLVQGEVAVRGRTDLDRLLHGELVYTGVLRTPVQSIVQSVFVDGSPCKVSSEYFSISADVYRLLGLLKEEDYDVATPDAGGKDLAACARRLARIVASEPEILGQSAIYSLARYVKEMQIRQVLEGIWQILSRLKEPSSKRLISAAQGAFLIEEAARRLEWDVIPWWECIPGGQSDCALTAFAAAWLLSDQRGV